MGGSHSNGRSRPDYSIHWRVRHRGNYYHYFIDGNRVVCERRGLISKIWDWDIGEYPISMITRNSEHILFLNSEGEVFILKYGSSPARVTLPWIADMIYSEQSLSCDFSLIFYRIDYSRSLISSNYTHTSLPHHLNYSDSWDSNWNNSPQFVAQSFEAHSYLVISVTASNSTYPRVRMDELRKTHSLNVTTFFTDTITKYGMFSKLLYIRDQGVIFMGKDDDIQRINSGGIITDAYHPILDNSGSVGSSSGSSNHGGDIYSSDPVYPSFVDSPLHPVGLTRSMSISDFQKYNMEIEDSRTEGSHSDDGYKPG